MLRGRFSMTLNARFDILSLIEMEMIDIKLTAHSSGYSALWTL
jgi:hypothetical protein